ncbi:hypothetical protein [Martelella endophytica]|uniref:Glucuronosyltransferase n=1 Tax=Martelella endophytica TaxID=1486262 RepID=A0A0D5LSB8_MAREN|nr:hypothetical protein [Martelella endophytica]AJY46971.1 hypothetical protein TM49_16830 [Martelella endophytica]
MKKLIAIASAGGHWVQLLRLRPAFEGCDVTYITTMKHMSDILPGEKVRFVPDASKSEKFRLFILSIRLFYLIIRIRPKVIVTTGAAPGVIALLIGRLLGANTVWIDSIANAEELSLSGRLAVGRADMVLSQWPEVAAKYEGVEWKGAVV